MSKYSIAKSAIDRTLEEAKQESIDANEALEALLTSAIERAVAQLGAAAAHKFVTFELASIAGEVDMDFVRSR